MLSLSRTATMSRTLSSPQSSRRAVLALPNLGFPQADIDAAMAVLREAIPHTVSRLPLFSSKTREAFDMAGDPSCDERRFARLLESDPGLTADVLRLANSAFFGGSSDVCSIPKAVRRIGLLQIRNLLLRLGVQRTLHLQGFPRLTERLQRRAVGVAHTARKLANAVGRPADPSHTAGLLHDIGWVAALETARAVQTDLPRSIQANGAEGLLILAEEAHAEAGATLAHRWGFPTGVTASIAAHHQPQRAVPKARVIVEVVAAATYLLDHLRWYPERTVADPSLEPLFSDLGVLAPTLVRLAEELPDELDALTEG